MVPIFLGTASWETVPFGESCDESVASVVPSKFLNTTITVPSSVAMSMRGFLGDFAIVLDILHLRIGFVIII